MRKLERLLVSCSLPSPSGYTIRKMIGFKQKSQYNRCVEELKKRGIRPAKLIRGGFIICCHLDRRRIAQLNSLMKHPDIKYIESDMKIRAHNLPPVKSKGQRAPKKKTPGPPSREKKGLKLFAKPAVSGNYSSNTTWNIYRVGAPSVWSSTRGGGVRVAIIDTGIASHPDLRVAGGINTIDGKSYLDDNGHGTHVAGIAAGLGTYGRIPGVAPRVSLYAVKALDANGEGYISDIIKGIDWCIKNGIRVINMSFGLQGATSEALREAIQRARNKGIVIVASAGNSGKNSGGIDAPASFSETIAVAASTKGNLIASYSSRGSGIDVTAPGSYIKSTWPGGGYKKLSGTSMASPHVAGGAALLLAKNPNLKPYQVALRLRSTARKLSNYGTKSQGYGLIRLARAYYGSGS